MLVRLVTKFDVPVYEYKLDNSGDDHSKIPNLGDHVTVDEERFMVIDRTFNLSKNEVILQVWKPVVEDPDYEENKI